MSGDRVTAARLALLCVTLLPQLAWPGLARAVKKSSSAVGAG